MPPACSLQPARKGPKRPLSLKKAPKGAVDKNGFFKVYFPVLVDTLGKANMATFAVGQRVASVVWHERKGRRREMEVRPGPIGGLQSRAQLFAGHHPSPEGSALHEVIRLQARGVKPATTKAATTKKLPV